jgi:hypothetical protein
MRPSLCANPEISYLALHGSWPQSRSKMAQTASPSALTKPAKELRVRSAVQGEDISGLIQI